MQGGPDRRRRSPHGEHRRWLRPLVIGVGLISVTLAGAGCGTASLSPRAEAQQQNYLNEVHGSAPDINSYRTDEELVRLGKAVCDDLRSGASYETVADHLATTSGASELPTVDLGAVITAAAQFYCPEYADRLS